MTDETVMRAVLAMDAYHRGASYGIDLPNGDPDAAGTQLGEASIIMTARDASTGFYAIAFELNGETVISYQGTDESIDYLAWFGGGGFLTNQAYQAASSAIGTAHSGASGAGRAMACLSGYSPMFQAIPIWNMP